MAGLVSKATLELELQTTLPIAYTTGVIEDYSDEAEAEVQLATNRATFTGSSATMYKRAVLLAMCMRIGASLPGLLKNNVSSISEMGTSITYRAGDGYRTEYHILIRRLMLRPTAHTVGVTTNNETFYSSTTEE